MNLVAIDLPSHVIVKLPALSPTMETGTIVSWEKNVGDEVEQGDVSYGLSDKKPCSLTSVIRCISLW